MNRLIRINVDNKKETIREKISLIQKLPLDTIIWRYLTFDKWYPLILSQKMFFAKADLFNDPYEGSFGEHMRNLSPGIVAMLLKMGLNRTGPRWFMMVSCWTISEIDIIDMWSRYTNIPDKKGLQSDETTPPKGGIAIQSTIGDLLASLRLQGKYGEFIHGAVTYKPFTEDELNTNYSDDLSLAVSFRKKPQYRNENEYRFAIAHQGKTENTIGLKIPVNLSRLIRKIIVSPNYDEEVAEGERENLKNLGIDVPVETSNLFDKPPF